MPRAPLAALALVLAGCLTPSVPAPPEAQDGAPAPEAAPAWRLAECSSTLHVWLVPLAELRERTPPEFPPAPLPQEGMDTPLGRIVFYLYDCARSEREGREEGRSLLGLLGVRVLPPREVAPPDEKPAWAVTPWVSIYLLGAFASGLATEALGAAGLPWLEAEGGVTLAATALPDAPTAEASLSLGGQVAFEASMQGVPGQVEAFNRPERYLHKPEPAAREVRWLDVQFNMTLWETEGRVAYAPGSPWERAVGSRAYDAGVDHHAMEAALDLSWGRGELEA